ncbi:MAG: hypothetical protein OXR62_07055 [Ahrensia sp.]|nr:hypothetical protein [Ahrensia sp.]
MATRDDGLDAMMNIWQESQAAFFKAQKEVADSFTKALSQTGQGADMAGSMAGNMADMSTMSGGVKAWQDFIKSWAPGWDPSAMMGQPNRTNMFNMGRDDVFSMLDASNWTQFAPDQLRDILMSIANGPRFADLAMPQVDAAGAWREVLDYQQATADFAKTMQKAWSKAYEEYSKSFTLEDLKAPDPGEALDAWLAAANEQLLDIQRSPEFLDAQRRMLRAGNEIKARQRDLAEQWSEAYQMPTRTEVDDLAKIVQELRREVRQLKRQLAAQ